MPTYTSRMSKELERRVNYYRIHPMKYIKVFENDFNIKLKWYQKIKLILIGYGFIKTEYQKQQENLDKLLRKYIR